jgi:hypothetical protein
VRTLIAVTLADGTQHRYGMPDGNRVRLLDHDYGDDWIGAEPATHVVPAEPDWDLTAGYVSGRLIIMSVLPKGSSWLQWAVYAPGSWSLVQHALGTRRMLGSRPPTY